MTDLEFYSRLNTLIEEAMEGGVSLATIVSDLALLSRVMASLHEKESKQ